MVKVAVGLAGVTDAGEIAQVRPATPDWGVQVRLTVPLKLKTGFSVIVAVPWAPGAAMLTRFGSAPREKSIGQAFTKALASTEPRPEA